MIVLVVNCGSSSLKYQLVNMDNEEVMAKGLVEKIGLPDSQLTHKWNGQKKEIQQSIPDHNVAVKLVLDILTDAECGVIKSMDAIDAVGHRVVHGGEEFAASTLITDEVMKALEKCSAMAPLHNPPNIIGINACKAIMPGVPQVGVFDTAFHQTMPAKASCTASRTNSIRKIISVVTASTARAIAMLPVKSLKSWANPLKNCASSTAISATARP